MIQERSIPVAILLSIVTCGIYGIYWFIKLTDETNQLAQGQGNETADGVVALLLSIVTCGIYSFYWTYKLGCKVDDIKGNGQGNSGILYVVLLFVPVGGIIVYVLAQDTVNKRVTGGM